MTKLKASLVTCIKHSVELVMEKKIKAEKIQNLTNALDKAEWELLFLNANWLNSNSFLIMITSRVE